MNIIIVKQITAHNRVLFSPCNEDARLFCRIAKSKYLCQDALDAISELGFEVLIKLDLEDL